MTTNAIDEQGPTLMQAAAGIAAASQSGLGSAGTLSRTGSGKPGDFDFLSGNWTIRNQRLKDGAWDHFDGEATVVGILGGMASVEELRIASRNFSGMGLRILDVERGLWADYWCNGSNGVLNRATWGGFSGGAGIWDAQETEGGKPVIVRGVWDQMTAASCRWRQLASRDRGMTWEENWIMHWQRSGRV